MEENKIEQDEEINIQLAEKEPELKEKIKTKIEVKQVKNNLFRYEEVNMNEETGEEYGTFQVMTAQELYMKHYQGLKSGLSQIDKNIEELKRKKKIVEKAELKVRPFIPRAREIIARDSEKSIKEKEKKIKEMKEQKANSLG